MLFSCCCVDAGDDAAVGPKVEKAILDYETRNQGYALGYVVNQFSLPATGSHGSNRDQTLAGQTFSETAKNQVAEQLWRTDRAVVPNLVDFPTDATTLQVDRRYAVEQCC